MTTDSGLLQLRPLGVRRALEFVIEKCRLAAAMVFMVLPANEVLAHDFGLGGDFYGEFQEGISATLGELPVMIAIVTAGFLFSLWDRDGLPRVWLAFLAGSVIGLILPIFLSPEPVSLAYATATSIGLLAAAAFRPNINIMRVIAFLAGCLPPFAMLSGHAAGSVPAGAYLGIVFALNVVLAISASLVSLWLTRFDFNWASIAIRALASWQVAVAVMAFAFLLR